MRTLFALLAAAALVVLCMGGCTLIVNSTIKHIHNGDTDVAVDAEAGLSGLGGSAMPVPKLVLPNPELPS